MSARSLASRVCAPRLGKPWGPRASKGGGGIYSGVCAPSGVNAACIANEPLERCGASMGAFVSTLKALRAMIVSATLAGVQMGRTLVMHRRASRWCGSPATARLEWGAGRRGRGLARPRGISCGGVARGEAARKGLEDAEDLRPGRCRRHEPAEEKRDERLGRVHSGRDGRESIQERQRVKEYVRVVAPQERAKRRLHIHSLASHLIQISRRRTNQAWRKEKGLNGKRYEVQERGTLKTRPLPSQPNIRGGIGAAVRPPHRNRRHPTGQRESIARISGVGTVDT